MSFAFSSKLSQPHTAASILSEYIRGGIYNQVLMMMNWQSDNYSISINLCGIPLCSPSIVQSRDLLGSTSTSPASPANFCWRRKANESCQVVREEWETETGPVCPLISGQHVFASNLPRATAAGLHLPLLSTSLNGCVNVATNQCQLHHTLKTSWLSGPKSENKKAAGRPIQHIELRLWISDF